jgi:uncharacterized membrane protein (UPF0127 family)
MAAQAFAQATPTQFQKLEIAGQSGTHTFDVELVNTDATRARGLMFRRELPKGQGMLFDFGREQEISMWMENTYIPLDMIFIKADGRILSIAENTEPLSRTVIPSGGPIKGVLEVIAGTTLRLGLRPGDQVRHPIFTGR